MSIFFWRTATAQELIDRYLPKEYAMDLSEQRRAALALLRSGEANPSEIARLAGVSRQAASMWAKVAGINWLKLRRIRIAKLWAAQLRRH